MHTLRNLSKRYDRHWAEHRWKTNAKVLNGTISNCANPELPVFQKASAPRDLRKGGVVCKLFHHNFHCSEGKQAKFLRRGLLAAYRRRVPAKLNSVFVTVTIITSFLTCAVCIQNTSSQEFQCQQFAIARSVCNMRLHVQSNSVSFHFAGAKKKTAHIQSHKCDRNTK